MADLNNGLNAEPDNQPIAFNEQVTASFEALIDQYRRNEIAFSDASHDLSLRIFVACNDLRRPGDAKSIFRSYYEELEAIRETNNVHTEPVQDQQRQQPAPPREASSVEQDQAEPRGATRKRLRAGDFFKDGNDNDDDHGDVAKRARRTPDESKFAFTKHKISYLLLDPLLVPLLVEISELNAEYSIDVNFAYNKILLSPKLPQFPRQLWKPVLLGQSVCFDRLYSALCAPNGDVSESKQLGEYEVISDALKVTHKVTKAEEWLRVFRKLAEKYRAALTRILRQLTRPAAQMGHTWEGGTTPADRPIILKDMLGQELIIPLELCSTFEHLDGLLKVYFKGKAGFRFVNRGDYELTGSEEGASLSLLEPSEWNKVLQPGGTIYMNAILPRMLTRGYGREGREVTCPKCEKVVEQLTLRRSVQCQYCQTWVTLSESFRNDEVTPLHWFERKVRNSTPKCLGPVALPTGRSAIGTPPAIVQDETKERSLHEDIAHFRRIRVLDRLPLEWARMLEAMRPGQTRLLFRRNSDGKIARGVWKDMRFASNGSLVCEITSVKTGDIHTVIPNAILKNINRDPWVLGVCDMDGELLDFWKGRPLPEDHFADWNLDLWDGLE